MFVFIIAMMVFGPRRLPEIAAKAGKIVAQLRGMSQGLLTEWQREINAEAYMEELRKTKNELDEFKKELSQAGSTVARETSDVARTIASPNLTQGATTEVKAAGEESLGTDDEVETATEIGPQEGIEPNAPPESELESAATTEAGSGVAANADTPRAETAADQEENPAPEKSSPTPTTNASSNSNPGPPSGGKPDNVPGTQTLKSEPAVND